MAKTKPTTDQRDLRPSGFRRCKPFLSDEDTRGNDPQTRADKAPVITGYAAVFYRADDPGTQYQLFDDLVERIMPGAFDNALAEGDVVRGLTNHHENWLLGRTDKGTVRLSVDEVGLRYEIDPPDTQAGRDTVALLKRGDLDASSFAFSVWGKRGEVVWKTETSDGETMEVREIHDLELFDVSPVTYAAYESTTSALRGETLARLRAELEQVRADRRHRAQHGHEQLMEMELGISGARQRLSRDLLDAFDPNR